MAGRNFDLPFDRGETYFGSQTPVETEATHLEGQEYEVPDTEHSTGRPVRLRVVRNVADIALEAKRLVRFDTGEALETHVDGYAEITHRRSYPVDDAYGSSTIADNDLFYIVVKGPCLIKTSLAGDGTNVLTLNEIVGAATAATSGATTAGRIRAATYAITGNTGQAQINEIFNAVGRAATARTTDNTNTDTLVMVGLW